MSPQPIDLPVRPVALQGVPAPGYSAVDLRRLALAGQAQEGVIAGGDFKVTQRAAGAGLAVDVAAGEALVQGDSISYQGLYYALLAAAATGAGELTVRAGDANPRIDQVVLQIFDAQHDGSGLNVARLRIIEGTPTAGATLDNRLGAAALPSNCVRLADYRMIAGGGSVPTAEIRDRRPWARGAYRICTRTATADQTTGSATTTQIATTEMSPRIECSPGAQLRVKFSGYGRLSVAGDYVSVSTWIDGASGTGVGYFRAQHAAIANQNLDLEPEFWPILAAGSHVIGVGWNRSGTGVATLFTSGADAAKMVVEEVVRQNAENS